jgi:DNA-binding MarR family transcriptional regulator
LRCYKARQIEAATMTNEPRDGGEETALTAEDYTALAAFRRGVRRYLAFAEAGARGVGLTSQQHQALLAIKAHGAQPSMSVGELATHLVLRHHSAAELATRLENAGYLERSGDALDRRRVRLRLTAQGERVLALLSTQNLQELRSIAPAFRALVDQLERVVPPAKPERAVVSGTPMNSARSGSRRRLP